MRFQQGLLVWQTSKQSKILEMLDFTLSQVGLLLHRFGNIHMLMMYRLTVFHVLYQHSSDYLISEFLLVHAGGKCTTGVMCTYIMVYFLNIYHQIIWLLRNSMGVYFNYNLDVVVSLNCLRIPTCTELKKIRLYICSLGFVW